MGLTFVQVLLLWGLSLAALLLFLQGLPRMTDERRRSEDENQARWLLENSFTTALDRAAKNHGHRFAWIKAEWAAGRSDRNILRWSDSEIVSATKTLKSLAETGEPNVDND